MHITGAYLPIKFHKSTIRLFYKKIKNIKGILCEIRLKHLISVV
ncbi:hypothetical protein HHE02_05590 [Helicobacter heilmannii]|nr:hypothetical protein HHE014_06250 [Helicobacter heilmannii]CRF47271.1 hypothetical protein HHE02_05590 [Helicobacter heilmannii]CRF48775.1 hypothetical protein HHE03_03490 [Helicobacter heilmannii]CRF51663.1 hypothetical protein HHE06_15510 [Helicobacter heilmannii]